MDSSDGDSDEMSGGVRVEVSLIGGQKIGFSVGARLHTQELVALVASHYALHDAHYFSLAYRNSSGHYQWLIENLRLLDHDFARGVKVLPLSFLVKYYPQSAIELCDPQAVEIFYHHAKDVILKGSLLAEKSVICKLSAYSLHVSHGDFLDKSTIKVLLRNSSLLPSRLKDEPLALDYCLDNVYEHYSQLKGTTRGEAILKYMREVEGVPGYGVHYYDVKDRTHSRFLLGISRTGIAEYPLEDQLKPKYEFLWQELENLYIRERKFSIEVHTANRAWGSTEETTSAAQLDTISEEIPGATASLRRNFWTGNLRVHAWLCETQQLCKDVWSMAIAQHQFYLERKTIKGREGMKDSFDLAGELSKSYLSLSAQSSPSISRSGSHSSIHQNSIADDTASTESLAAARLELLAALQQRHDALQQKLNEKTKELKIICVKEGELTGELPAEYPLNPGEPPPAVRKRVGTSFTIEEALIGKLLNKQDETISALELDYEIQTKIATAALKLANESSLRKGVRRQRKHSCQQALTKLKEIERKLKLAKGRQMQSSNSSSTMPKMKKKPRPFSDTEGAQDDSYVSRAGTAAVRSCDYMETSLLNTSHTSVGSARPPHRASPLPVNNHVEDSHLKRVLQSAPPSPLVGSDSSSSHNAVSDGSRASSPGRPVSGYIPSGVYTRNQYRTQHYPTLSTRGQSVPLEVSHQDQSFTRAVFNIPQQRGSIVSHSLDDLDASINQPPQITAHSPYSPPCAFGVGGVTPQAYKFHHHHYDHHSRRPATDSQERYGSLDRRRAGSGRFESRSMEQLNDGNGALPQLATPTYPITPTTNNAYPYRNSPTEGELFPDHPYPSRFNKSEPDSVDGLGGATPRRSHSSAQSRQLCVHKTTPVLHGPHDADPSLNAIHRMVRTPSGRSYIETSFTGEAAPSPNQENIPPGCQRSSSSKPDPKPCLRATASINAADHQRLYRVPVNELPQLRATKSTVDLPPPLKPTNNQHELVSRAVNVPLVTCARDPTHPAIARSYGEEPLVSLAEAARSHKDRRIWTNESTSSDSNHDRPINYHQRAMRSDSLPPREPAQLPPQAAQLMPPATQTAHNISSSSSGSSIGSVFPPASDQCDTLNSSLNATLTVESPSNCMLINAGSFQPSREMSKPFEMSDFYKYSTKYRRQSSGHLGGPGDRFTDSPLPIVPPKDSPSIVHPPSPGIVARHSSPAPQQKGVYHPPTLMTCQPVAKLCNGTSAPDGSTGHNQSLNHALVLIPGRASPAMSVSNHSPGIGSTTWENGQVHQAVPATVTTKRAATLV